MEIFEMFIAYGLPGLFLIAFISSIIPIPTEPVVFGLLKIEKTPEIILAILITGSITGAYLGYLVGKYELRKLIPFRDTEKEKRMQMQFRRYGALFLLASPWIPLVGDIAPIVAGVENYGIKRFLIVISAAKFIKAVGMVYGIVYLFNWWTLFVK